MLDPSQDDHVKLMKINQDREWPSMFGFVDCMYWIWKSCPTTLGWAFQDKDKKESTILEAICDQSLWVWQALFGLMGGNNDLNVLDCSPLIPKLVEVNANNIDFSVNGT